MQSSNRRMDQGRLRDEFPNVPFGQRTSSTALFRNGGVNQCRSVKGDRTQTFDGFEGNEQIRYTNKKQVEDNGRRNHTNFQNRSRFFSNAGDFFKRGDAFTERNEGFGNSYNNRNGFGNYPESDITGFSNHNVVGRFGFTSDRSGSNKSGYNKSYNQIPNADECTRGFSRENNFNGYCNTSLDGDCSSRQFPTRGSNGEFRISRNMEHEFSKSKRKEMSGFGANTSNSRNYKFGQIARLETNSRGSRYTNSCRTSEQEDRFWDDGQFANEGGHLSGYKRQGYSRPENRVMRAPLTWVPDDISLEDIFAKDREKALLFDNEEDANVTVIGANNCTPISSWDKSDLHSTLISTCIEKCCYKQIRPIQSVAVPLIMDGYDLIGQTETGSGKTAAFVLPILNYILKLSDYKRRRPPATPYALVIAPTRELAKQLYNSFRKHSYDTDVSCRSAYGEYSRLVNLRDICTSCDILIGTIGRLSDFICKGEVKLSHLKFFVLDEADALLQNCDMNDLYKIINDEDFPHVCNRQTLLFSATFTTDLESLTQQIMNPNKYVMVTNGSMDKANPRVEQRFENVNGVSDKNDRLLKILNEEVTSVSEHYLRTLVFVDRKNRADFVALQLAQKGIKAESINSNRPQDERERVVKQLRDGEIHVLVGTDVCQRGLDISGLNYVINYDLPRGTEEQVRTQYIHRIGRTGRLYKGVAITFISPRDSDNVKMAKVLAKVVREVGQIPPHWLVELCGDTIVDNETTGFGYSGSFGFNSGLANSSKFGTNTNLGSIKGQGYEVRNKAEMEECGFSSFGSEDSNNEEDCGRSNENNGS